MNTIGNIETEEPMNTGIRDLSRLNNNDFGSL